MNQEHKKGKLIVFSAPSGSGKTTIVRHLLGDEDLNLEFSISATSREKRGTEEHGKDYYFLSAEEFKSKIKNDEFLEETAWSRGRWSSVTLNPVVFSLKEDLKTTDVFEENNGLLEVEAEAFHHNSNNESPRKWYVRSEDHPAPFSKVTDHTATASGEVYIEALLDTRVTHGDVLIQGENFFPVPGTRGVVSYKVKINNPGTYYVWVKAYPSGPEDNGLHVGVDGAWPENGQRIQLCQGKHKWTWSSAQRVPENHCGYTQTITLDFENAGDYVISFSMREDGFELDKWILAKDKNYIPE